MGLIRLLLILFVVMVIADAVLSYFPNSQSNEWAKKLRKICDYVLNPLRRLFPADMPFDVTPMIIILGVLVLLQIEIIIHVLVKVLIVMVIIDAIFSYFPKLQEKEGIKRYRKLMSYGLDPIRRFLPSDVPFDISPVLLIALLVVVDKLW